MDKDDSLENTNNDNFFGKQYVHTRWNKAQALDYLSKVPTTHVCMSIKTELFPTRQSRPTLSQFWNFKIRCKPFPTSAKIVDRRISMLQNREMVDRESREKGKTRK